MNTILKLIISLQKLFGKLFGDDIKYLLSMDKLWEKRRRPTPLDWDEMPEAGNPFYYLKLTKDTSDIP